MNYAKKIIHKKGSTFLSLQEKKQMDKTFNKIEIDKKKVELNKKQKITLGLCGLSFIIMIIGFIHPTTKKYVEYEAPLPEYFQELLEIGKL